MTTVEHQQPAIEQNGYEYYLREVLVASEEIQEIVRGLASRISEKYKGKNPLFVIVLNGALIFGHDLLSKVNVGQAQYDTFAISSYPEGTESSKQPIITKDIKINIQGRHVIIVEDIVDTGWSLKAVRELFESRHPASLAVCALLDKIDRRETPVPIEFVGRQIEDKFVVGYGLDVDEHFRLLPNIRVAERIDTKE